MKQYGFLGLVLSASVSMFAGEAPEAKQDTNLKQSPHVLKSSNSSGSSTESLRKSSDAITIALLKKAYQDKTEEQKHIVFSGSSPIGIEYLFPGQSGLGYRDRMDVLPVDPHDQAVYKLPGRVSFYYYPHHN
jgi:hypothetical protein